MVRSPPLAVVALFVALACALFAPVLFAGRWFAWDVPDQYWPDLRFLCSSLHRGTWPLWNPYDRGGYPFHADPQSGLYYPGNWAICAVAGASPGLGWAQLRVALHFALAGCAMTGFLRAVGLRWGPAVLGGVGFMLAPFQRRMWGVNPSYTIAYLPVVLWALERLARRPCARTCAAVALAAAVATSVGSPPALYFVVLASGAYALCRTLARPAALAWLALAGVLAAAMCAVMVLPTAELARHSVQQGHDYGSISAGAYRPRELVGLVWPRAKYLYLGAPALALAAAGALHPRSPLSRAQRLCFAALALFALAMMFGDHSPVYRAAFGVIPGVSSFREPVRYSAVLGAAVAVLAAAGAQTLPRPRWSPWLACALVLASVAPALPGDEETRGGPVPGGDARWAAVRARMGDVRGAWRFYDEFGVGLRAGTRYRARDFRGYQDPLLLARYERVVGRLAEYPRMLEQYNVRYVLRGSHFMHGTSHHFLPAGREAGFARELGDGVWETRAPLPAAYWVPRAELLPDDDAVLAQLRARAPAAVCLLSARDGPRPAAGAAIGASGAFVAARSVENRGDSVTARIDAPADGWLVVNEVYYPGWSATVDGRPVALRRANHLVRALPVARGTHRVELAYRPPRYAALSALALAALGACAAMLAWPRRARNEPP